MKTRGKRGFTLVELLVVVIIIGILSTLGVPYYLKTVEASKSEDALAIGHMLSIAHRMYRLDHQGETLTGTLTDTCNSYTCASAPDGSACKLVACGYIAKQSWNNAAYMFSTGDGGLMASAWRRTGSPPGTNSSPYRSWRYNFDASGICKPSGGAPDCPSF